MGENRGQVYGRTLEEVEERQSRERKPHMRRGRCPHCGEWLYAALYYMGGRGYLMAWECEGNFGDPATCNYRRVL